MCGDGIENPTEQCDDGNTTRGDGCSSICRTEFTGEITNGTQATLTSSLLSDEEKVEIKIEFDKENVNYDILAMQKDQIVLNESEEFQESGEVTYKTDKLSSDTPLVVTITFQGYENVPLEERTGKKKKKIIFNNVIPEFGPITMMILGVAITSIILLSFRSKIITRF